MNTIWLYIHTNHNFTQQNPDHYLGGDTIE